MASVSQVAEWVNGAVGSNEGNLDQVSGLDTAGPNCVVFAINTEALHEALASTAGLILVDAQLAKDVSDPRLLRVADARLAFSEVARHLEPIVAGAIHPTAVIAASAMLGSNVVVQAGAVIGERVRVGNGCRIGARVVLENDVILCSRVTIQAGAVIGALGFGYARRPDGTYLRFPQQGAVVIEDDVEIGANTTIDRGALGETRIGAGTKIDNLVHIGHNCQIGRNVIIAAQTGISGSSTVADGAILGGQVGIGEHAHVGENVILGGGAGVLSGKKLRGPHQVFWGRPARPLKQYLRDLARLSRGR